MAPVRSREDDCMTCEVINTKKKTPISVKTQKIDVAFDLPVEEKDTWSSHEETVSRSGGNYADLTKIDVSNVYCPDTLATLYIFRVGAMDAAGIESWYKAMEEKFKKDIIGEGYEFGSRSCRDSEQRWIYAEAVKGRRVVNRQYKAIVGEFVISIYTCHQLPVDSLVNSLVIDGNIKCKPLEI